MKTNESYKVILADDHVLLRDALAALIDSFEECKIIAVASNGKELVRLIEAGQLPNIVVLDLNMPQMDGYETAQWLQDKHPDIKILILTMYDSEIALIRLLQVGVRGFLKNQYRAVSALLFQWMIYYAGFSEKEKQAYPLCCEHNNNHHQLLIGVQLLVQKDEYLFSEIP